MTVSDLIEIKVLGSIMYQRVARSYL